MKKHKTPTHLRGSYKQYDEDGRLLCEIKPGDYGVTEVTIDQMHRMEDAEVRVHIKESRVPAYMEETVKAVKEQWIADFEAKYGYKPHPADVPDFTHRSFVSTDADVETEDGEDSLGDNSRLAALLATPGVDEEEESASEYMRRLVMTGEGFTQREREVYDLVFIQGLEKKDAAGKLGIVPSRVTEIIGQIMKKVGNDPELRKMLR